MTKTGLRWMGLALVLATVSTAGCRARSLPPLQEFAVSGEPATLRLFQGTWYDHDGIAVVRVERSRGSSFLAVRLVSDFTIEDAEAADDNIRFRLLGPDYDQHLELRLVEPDRLVQVFAGGDVGWCGTCTPRYSRSWRFAGITNRIEEAWGEGRELGGRAVYWLAGAL